MLSLNRKSVLLYSIMSLVIVVLGGCGGETDVSVTETSIKEESLATLRVINPSEFDRTDELIMVDAKLLGINPDISVAVDYENQTLPTEWLDRDGDDRKDTLLLPIPMPKASSVRFDIIAAAVDTPKQTSAEISRKIEGAVVDGKYKGGRFESAKTLTTPDWYADHAEYIRYEGPGIESKEVGYRLYLDWRNGLDVFGKTVPNLVLAKIGLDGYDSYHEPQDWGMDVLKVGSSAGIGGFGAWVDGKVQRVSEVGTRSVDITHDGPLYSEISIDYKDWQFGDATHSLNARLSMKAKSRLAEVRLNTSPELNEMAVTLPKHEAGKVIRGSLDITGEAWSYLATFGPQAMAGENLGLVVFFKRRNFSEFAEDDHNHVVALKSRNGVYQYYFAAVWGGEQQSRWTEETFNDFLVTESDKLTLQPRVQIDSQTHRSEASAIGYDSLLWASRAAHSEIRRHDLELAFGSFDTMRDRLANWEYTTGLLTQSVYDHGLMTDDETLVAWAEEIISSYITESGDIHTYRKDIFNIDSINSGKMLLRLYRDTGKEKYWLAAGKLRDQLRDHPKLDVGAFWHKKRYPYQLWLDGVYMGMPFLVEYALMTNDREALREAVHEFELVDTHMRDSASGLYYHAWDESRAQSWADSETGLSSFFWGRGMGWFAMALVDTLALLPESETGLREPLERITRQFAKDIMPFRNANGVWYQIVDQPEGVGNYEEASVSAMFTYFLARGVNLGVLPQEFREAALSSYRGLIDQFALVDGGGEVHLQSVCQVGGLGFGRDGSYRYYMSEPVVSNDPKGLGPFIALGREIHFLSNTRSE